MSKLESQFKEFLGNIEPDDKAVKSSAGRIERKGDQVVYFFY